MNFSPEFSKWCKEFNTAIGKAVILSGQLQAIEFSRLLDQARKEREARLKGETE